MDAQITPKVSYRETQGTDSYGICDLPIAFNFQLVTSSVDAPWPAMKLILGTSIPIGKYQNSIQVESELTGWEKVVGIQR
jgi:hypothetical protein